MDFGFPILDGFVASGSNVAALQVSDIETHNHKLLNFHSAQAPLPSKHYGFTERTPLNYAGFLHYQSSPSAYQPSNGARGPLTPSQRMELEYQVLIFKYLSASVPVPPELLTNLVEKPLYLYPHGSSGGFYSPDSFGWGTLASMGYTGGPVQSEPGRCRRTDGKKWRCSRDVVGDQKYCERHMNRGRYRTRKQVDGQTVPATVQTDSNVVEVISSISAPVINSNEPLNVITFTVPKPIEEEPSDSFSSSKRKKYQKSRDCDESTFLSLNEETQDQHPLRQFIENWPRDQCRRSANSWPEELKSDWTQLTMTTPMQDKIELSPLRLSREYDPTQMGLGLIGDFSEPNQNQNKWASISQGISVGNPLGEVLISSSTGNAGCNCKSP